MSAQLPSANGRESEKQFWNFLNRRVILASGLREVLAEGYGRRDLMHDLSAGAVVGLVAIPLSMALAIASGVPPQHGLYTAVAAGTLSALFGGSRVQVTGPTAAFVVILAPITHQYGMAGLVLASLMAGIILFAMGVARFGRLIQFVPYPVTTGFTAGIAVVIAVLQIKDVLGLHVEEMPELFVGKVGTIASALGSFHLPDALVALGTLLGLIYVPRVIKRIPSPLVMLVAAGLVAAALEHWAPAYSVATISSRFHHTIDGVEYPGIPQLPPLFVAPWHWPGPNGEPVTVNWELPQALLPSAFAIAMLAAIESLLSAVIADGMTGHKHDPDSELMALGLGNIVSACVGGFAATGAIARTAANIRFGARSPFAAVVHAHVVLITLVAGAPLLGYLPMASLGALLLLVAWNMAEARHFLQMLRIAPRSDIFVLLACFTLTVLFDMVVAVTAGLLLASLLFIRRMAEVSSVTLVSNRDETTGGVHHGLLQYQIAGPLFFGAAEKAMSSLGVVGGNIHTVLFDFRQVPAMDVTGLVNLQSAVRKLQSRQIRVVLGGLAGQPLQVLEKAGWLADPSVLVAADYADAVAAAQNSTCPMGAIRI